jgi:hypothetical membrane protein
MAQDDSGMCMSKIDRASLLFGLICGTALIVMSTILGALLPGYDPIRQTISEIGEQGSPFERIFQITLIVPAVCFIVFAYGVYRFSSVRHVSVLPALALGFLGLTDLGSAAFASPHALHNLFGISKTLGLLAPMLLAITWPSAPDVRVIRRVSGVAGSLVLISVALNYAPVFVSLETVRASAPWLEDYYGLIQRTLFVFFAWCVFLAVSLFQHAASARQADLTRTA